MMTAIKKPVKAKQLRAELNKELQFLKNIFSAMPLPLQMKGESEENMDYEIINELKGKADTEIEKPKRARTIAELEEKLEKIKAQKNFNLKSKLAKKSLNSKLNKKIKKKERIKNRAKPIPDATPLIENMENGDTVKKEKIKKEKKSVPKPVFNTDGKLVFSKFDFANVGQHEKSNKGEKDPKKLLENLKQQEEKIKKIEETEDKGKAKEIKEKIAWKSVLQKAEGQKIKDDPTLLKKSIKKMEQKKKQSQKKWDTRIKGVEQGKEERQKKRRENISKKRKEKKSKIVKAAAKRGRIVI